jgi:hypothetical protein
MVTLGPMAQAALVYLWKKVVCFVLSCWDLPKPQCFKPCSWYLWKALGEYRCIEKLLMNIGASTSFETNWSYNVEAIDYWTIFSMKIKYIRKNIYIRIWGHSLCCWKAVGELDLIELFHNFQR